jgi:hypothetical protein
VLPAVLAQGAGRDALSRARLFLADAQVCQHWNIIFWRFYAGTTRDIASLQLALGSFVAVSRPQHVAQQFQGVDPDFAPNGLP